MNWTWGRDATPPSFRPLALLPFSSFDAGGRSGAPVAKRKYKTIPPVVASFINVWFMGGRTPANSAELTRITKALRNLDNAGCEFVKALDETCEALGAIGPDPLRQSTAAQQFKWRSTAPVSREHLKGKDRALTGEHFDAFTSPIRQVAECLGFEFQHKPIGTQARLLWASNSLGAYLGAALTRNTLVANPPQQAEGYVRIDDSSCWTLPERRGRRRNPGIDSIAIAAVQAEMDGAERATPAKLANAIEERANAQRVSVPRYELDDPENPGLQHESLRNVCEKALRWARKQLMP